MSKTILITGASSGLGLAFLQHYAAQSPTSRIIALDCNPFPSSLATSKIDFHNIDITSESQIQHIASILINTPIDLLLHCAGVRGLVPRVVQESEDVAASETWQAMNATTMLKTFEINTFGTFNTISAFLPFLLKATDSKAIVLSSRMGSISGNTSGGGYAYRASKAALNAVIKSFSIDVPEVTFLLLHPGRVETGLVGWKEDGAIGVEESVRDCARIVEVLGREGSGTFLDRFGMEIGW